jgi:hypothetical protein
MRRWFVTIAVALALVCAVTAAPKKKKAPETLALISGTVFHSSGFSLPGAKVAATSEQDRKVKVESRTGQRGEFALRVPAAKGPYVVTAQAKGFEAQQRTAEVYESQKTTITFQLKPKNP